MFFSTRAEVVLTVLRTLPKHNHVSQTTVAIATRMNSCITGEFVDIRRQNIKLNPPANNLLGVL